MENKSDAPIDPLTEISRRLERIEKAVDDENSTRDALLLIRQHLEILEKGMRNNGYSKETTGLIHLLAARSNDSKKEVLLKALTLYGLVLDAKDKGQHLAIIDSDDVIVHEILGVGTPEFAFQKAAI